MTQTIFLTQGYYTTLDDEDFDRLRCHLWWTVVKPGAHNQLVYAQARIDGRYQYMHGCILPYVRGKEINHKDHDGLNNRRMNLEYVTRSGNLRHGRSRSTRSGCRYISPTRNDRWEVRVTVEYVVRHVGTYDTVDEALVARNTFLAQHRIAIPTEWKEGFELASAQDRLVT